MHKGFLCAFLALASYGQSFDVASIRLADPKTNGGWVRFPPGGRFSVTSCELKFIIQEVYGLKEYQIVDGPKWISEWDFRYNIEARSADKETPDQVKAMAQALLAERFGLKVHRETRDVPVYLLVPAKGGVKLKPPSEKRGGIEFVSPGFTRGRKVQMEQFISGLARELDRPILDRTGFADAFDFDLNWAPEHGPADDPRPSLFAAIQEQMGLKLDARKAPVEVLVIEHAEKPTGN